MVQTPATGKKLPGSYPVLANLQFKHHSLVKSMSCLLPQQRPTPQLAHQQAQQKARLAQQAQQQEQCQ